MAILATIDFAVRRLKSGAQSRDAAALAFQNGQGELDVLAGAERVGGEIRTRAVVVSRLHAANVDAIGIPRLRIKHIEDGKNRMFAGVFEAKVLLAAELTA
jgi:hypothetical protein